MKISIQEKLLTQFPSLKVGVLFLQGMSNGGNSDITYQLLCKIVEKIKREDMNSNEDIWTETFSKLGIKSEITPSHITLLNRITQSTSDLPNISNAVNIINKVQLTTKTPIGIHDADKVQGDVTIGYNEKGLKFEPRENDQTVEVPKEEITYFDSSHVITRNWANKQGRKSLVSNDTYNAFVVIDTLDMSAAILNEIILELADNFNTFVKAKKISFGTLNSNSNILDLEELKEITKFRSINITGCRTISRDQRIIERIITKGVEDVLPSKDRLKELLNSGKRLRIYQGFDPTAPTLHVGHTVMMRKLEDFRKLGHEVFMLIGDFTGRIGDPTDKSSARVTLSESQVIENLKLYKEQASSLISINDSDNPVTVVFNNDWLGKLKFAEVVDIASEFTVQQMLKRDMFQRRLEEDKPIYLHEFLYPLMQGFDSLSLNVDVELGGNDQLFNMLAGRTLLEKRAKKDKVVMTGKLLTTSEGKKMGKSEGNMIMLSDSPENIYGKVMAFSDGQIVSGFELLTNTQMDEVEQIQRDLKNGTNPMELKKRLAFLIVTELKGEESAISAQKYFEGVFQKQNTEVELETIRVSKSQMNILDLMIETGMSKSKSDARRLVEQGAVYINDEKFKGFQEVIETDGKVLKVGRRVVKILNN